MVEVPQQDARSWLSPPLALPFDYFPKNLPASQVSLFACEKTHPKGSFVLESDRVAAHLRLKRLNK
jgi:hypothetical protein